VPEVARLGRTLRQWRQQILAYFTSGGVNNGGTEAISLLIEKTRRLAHASAASSTAGSGSCPPRTAHGPTRAGRGNPVNHAES
jgi:Transposase